MKIINIIIYLSATLMSFIGGISIYSFFLSPESYKFGTEVDGFMYHSSGHYLLVNLLVLAIAILAILSLLKGCRKIAFGSVICNLLLL